jgi:farnesyl-diphosphate farnesyltransferase
VFHSYIASEISSDEKDYLQHQLENVSRTFALVVPCVEPPARYYLATAYLLCRVVDNIEDCTQAAAWKDERFGEFLALLDDPRGAGDVLEVWQDASWPGLTDREAGLMGCDGGFTLWQVYAQMPVEARDIVRRWTSLMAQGMRQLGDPERGPRFVRRDGVDVLQEEVDYDSYCYYVAGTVGSMASELIVRQYQLTADVAANLTLRAEACGRSLQKTNIIKDFAEDVARGICYLPNTWLREAAYQPLSLHGAPPAWTAMVLSDVLHELREATDYVLALPYHAAGYRRASLLCLLPAYQTVLLAAQRHETLFTAQHAVKISKPTMARCLAESQTLLHSNDAIRRYSRRAEGAVMGQFKSFTSTSTNAILPN